MAPTSPLSTSRATILVVDDAPGQRLAIEAALAELGETVVAVGSGGAALRFLLEEDAAVILLDVNMPGMDGFETASLIRQRPRSRLTPIIFLTANTDELAAARAYSLGAVDYIFSPFSPDVLRAKVRVFVELAKMQDRQRREAEHRIALSREQAARAAAEEETRRLRVLAEASGILTGSLDTATLVAGLLGLFVPRMADVAAVTLVDRAGGDAETSWRDGDGPPRVGQLAALRGVAPPLATGLERALETGAAATAPAANGSGAGRVAVPLIAHGRTFGALALAFTGSPRHYAEADLHLVSDIAARAAIAFDNSRLYQAINERDRLKDEFLAMLSHELRNPLGAIRSAVHVLDAEEALDEPGRRARSVIGRQADHLARMVDDLLEVARLTAGRIAMAQAPVELSGVVEHAVDTVRVAGHGNHHTLRTQLAPVTVLGDATRIEQIVSNLLVNALKYTDRGGRIDVEVTAEGDEAVVRVRDTGIGITAEMLPRLFELFSQGRQALDRSKGGLGIGLTLVRRLTELHGGRVEAASDGPGRGSVFTVRLPRAAATAADGAAPATRAASPGSLRVLLVEDNEDARDMLHTVLKLAGHEVHDAADGVTALRLAAELKPHVALIDLGLPGVDGLEVAARLRARADGERPLLVAVTGYGQQADRERTRHAGFDLHLTKPVDLDRLTEVVAEAARRSLAHGDVTNGRLRGRAVTGPS